jgi:RNA polymerase sigma-70 factor (ECF subfamily)
MPSPTARNDFERRVKGELAVLYRVARRMGATPEEAEDLVQTTLVKAFAAWEMFDGRFLRSWLIRILRNERLMALRSDRHESSLDEGTEVVVSEGPFWDDLTWRLEAQRVLKELESLPDIYQIAIQLIDVEQLSYEEAAEAMDVPIGTVRSRLFRGREMLRNKMAAQQERRAEVHP